MRATAPSLPVPSELEEQTNLFRWAELEAKRFPELHLLFHVPNEGRRSYRLGAAMRASGLRKGVPDLWLPVARGKYHGLVIELKRIKHSKTSQEQLEWLRKLREQDYRAEIAYGWEEAACYIMQYLKNDSGSR